MDTFIDVGLDIVGCRWQSAHRQLQTLSSAEGSVQSPFMRSRIDINFSFPLAGGRQSTWMTPASWAIRLSVNDSRPTLMAASGWLMSLNSIDSLEISTTFGVLCGSSASDQPTYIAHGSIIAGVHACSGLLQAAQFAPPYPAGPRQCRHDGDNLQVTA